MSNDFPFRRLPVFSDLVDENLEEMTFESAKSMLSKKYGTVQSPGGDVGHTFDLLHDLLRFVAPADMYMSWIHDIDISTTDLRQNLSNILSYLKKDKNIMSIKNYK